jgi:hypothetical protein
MRTPKKIIKNSILIFDVLHRIKIDVKQKFLRGLTRQGCSASRENLMAMPLHPEGNNKELQEMEGI